MKIVYNKAEFQRYRSGRICNYLFFSIIVRIFATLNLYQAIF